MTKQQFGQRLLAYGIRPTAQRLTVYEYLYTHPIHPSAETIYQAVSEQYPTFSRTTVYNSLHTLVRAGLVRELALSTDEKRYDANIALHGHCHCRICGQVEDIPLPSLSLEAYSPADFLVEQTGLTFEGVCPRCRTAQSTTVSD